MFTRSYRETRYFNPRFREGSDSNRHRDKHQGHISIHASAKEATGSRHIHLPRVSRFQSTLPRRKRPISLAFRSAREDFNPRFREGSDDLTAIPADVVTGISIHASAKEATAVPPVGTAIFAISIHASAKEATVKDVVSDIFSGISIHASAKEATQILKHWRNKFRISIHASAKEATLTELWKRMSNNGFQSTLPRRKRPFAQLFLLLGGLFQSTLPRRKRLV